VENKIKDEIKKYFDLESRGNEEGQYVYMEKKKTDSKESVNLTHLVLARENTRAGEIYNKFTYSYIRELIRIQLPKAEFQLLGNFREFMKGKLVDYLDEVDKNDIVLEEVEVKQKKERYNEKKELVVLDEDEMVRKIKLTKDITMKYKPISYDFLENLIYTGVDNLDDVKYIVLSDNKDMIYLGIEMPQLQGDVVGEPDIEANWNAQTIGISSKLNKVIDMKIKTALDAEIIKKKASYEKMDEETQNIAKALEHWKIIKKTASYGEVDKFFPLKYWTYNIKEELEFMEDECKNGLIWLKYKVSDPIPKDMLKRD